METIKPKSIKTEVSATPIVKELEPVKETKVTISLPLVFITMAIIAAGGFTGYVLAQGGRGIGLSGGTQTTTGGAKKIVGVADEKTFKDSAEGTLREGGVDGEGTHHLERPGGPSQNVYLTSSTIGLVEFVGKQVKVWGETFAAEKAGWLMDVGRLEVLE